MERKESLIELFLPFSMDIMLVLIELVDWRACLLEEVAAELKHVLSLGDDGEEGYQALIDSEFFMLGYEHNESNQIEVATLLTAMNQRLFRGIAQAHLLVDGKYYGKSGDDMSTWPIRFQRFLS